MLLEWLRASQGQLERVWLQVVTPEPAVAPVPLAPALEQGKVSAALLLQVSPSVSAAASGMLQNRQTLL